MKKFIITIMFFIMSVVTFPAIASGYSSVVNNYYNSSTAIERFSHLPSVQHQFAPNDKRWQGSMAIASGNFDQQGSAAGIAIGKQLECDSCGEIFVHGNLATDSWDVDRSYSANVGATAFW